MRYYLDTEFIEDGKTIDLISIGIVDEGGRTYYAVNRECKFSQASPWVWEHVLYPMGIHGIYDICSNPGSPDVSPRLRETILASRSRDAIAAEIVQFVGSDDDIQFWADYGAYGWVALCQLYGTMMDLPRGFPMYCNELQQALSAAPGKVPLPECVGAHNALNDAIWCKKVHELIILA